MEQSRGSVRLVDFGGPSLVAGNPPAATGYWMALNQTYRVPLAIPAGRKNYRYVALRIVTVTPFALFH